MAAPSDAPLDIKAIVLGDSDVGKTSITMRYCEGAFSPATSATIGASFLQKSMSVQDVPVVLQLWDTAGQERFRSMTPMYYRNSRAAVLVCDCSKAASLEGCKRWLKDFTGYVSDAVVAIAVNKSDLEDEGPVELAFSEVSAFAASVGARAYRTSARTGEGIDALFADVAEQIVRRDVAARPNPHSIRLTAPPPGSPGSPGGRRAGAGRGGAAGGGGGGGGGGDGGRSGGCAC